MEVCPGCWQVQPVTHFHLCLAALILALVLGDLFQPALSAASLRPICFQPAVWMAILAGLSFSVVPWSLGYI